MDLDRFLELPATTDGRRVVTLMADPSMLDEHGQPVGFLSLVDKGANQRRFQVVKAADLAPGQGPTDAPGSAEHAPTWLTRFLASLGLGSLVATKGDEVGPLTFDAAITAERLRRARWEATDALWDVIRNVMKSDLVDKPGAVQLALSQFSSVVMGLVSATTAMKSEDVPTILAAFDPPADLVSKAGKVISAGNLATIRSAQDALAKAAAALEALIKVATPSPSPDPLQEEPVQLNLAQLESLASKAAESAVKAAKAAGISDPSVLAQHGAAASTEVYKAAVMGPAQAAMPTDALAQQLAGSMSGGAPDPHAAITQALGAVTALTTKVDALVAKVNGIDTALNGTGEGEAREPGMLELATKSAELADAVAAKVAKLEGTPAAPRGAGDPPALDTKAELARKRAAESDPWTGSALEFNPAAKPAPAAKA